MESRGSYGAASSRYSPAKLCDLLWVNFQETCKKTYVNNINVETKTCYALCRMCKKAQVIDLEKEGYGPSFMDHFQPDIRISDW